MAGYGVDDKGQFGFGSVQDWVTAVLESYPAPWKVMDLDGKYYGTRIADARGIPILSVWKSEGRPSDRQRQDMTDAEWAEYCTDVHWESAWALALAERIVDQRAASWWHRGGEFALTVVEHAEWAPGLWEELLCGGPERRRLEPEKRIDR